MNASDLVSRILDSAYRERRPAFLLLVGTVFVLVAVASRSANGYGNCTMLTQGCSWGGALPPCSNTTFCYNYDGGPIFCPISAYAITAYMNSAPPSGWTNCHAKCGAGACNDVQTACGTQSWFWNSAIPRVCDSDHSCNPNYSYGGFCKGPAADPNCS